LVKDFGTTRALDCLTVRTGAVHGSLGPNGAGKTTTIRILLGLLRRSGGEVTPLGGDPWREAADLHRRLAYVPGEVNLWSNQTGGEVIDLLGALRGGLVSSRRSELLDRFQLDPTKKCRAYSKGNRQKVALVAAFSSDVELYLLDEPTSGLDPLMETVSQDVVRDQRAQGRTVALSSHTLSGVEALCDRVTIIPCGRAAETDTFNDLRHLTRTTVDVETARPLDDLSGLEGVNDVSIDLNRARFSVDSGGLNAMLRYLVAFDVRSLSSSPPTLEDLFLRHYGDNLEVVGGRGVTEVGATDAPHAVDAHSNAHGVVVLWWVDCEVRPATASSPGTDRGAQVTRRGRRRLCARSAGCVLPGLGRRAPRARCRTTGPDTEGSRRGA
jgi:ABC-2 type transport system ATP-binding protein